MLHTRKPQTEETVAEMQARNQRRVEIAKRILGDRYAHHPSQHVKPHHMRQAELHHKIEQAIRQG